MTTQITRLPVSHVDHGLTEEQLAWLLVEASARLLDEPPPWGAPYIASFELPEELGTVPCGLHGPRAGDQDPVEEDEVTYAVRGERAGKSRLCARPPKQTRKVTLIAGEHEGEPWVLFTAFGGPLAPREPFEFPETIECPECRGRGWHGTLAIGGPSPATCYACKGEKVVPNPERIASAAYWAEHALSA